MKKIFINSLNILKGSPLFVQPVLLFLLLIMSAVPYLVSPNVNIYPKSFLALSLLLMTIAFNAGFFKIVKLSNETYNPDDEKEISNEKSLNNLKSFFSGVTEGFVKYFFALVLLFGFYALVSWAVSYFGLKFFGIPEFINNSSLETAKINTNEQMTEFVNSISDKDKSIISAWTFSITIIGSIINYIAVLFLTVLAFTKNNIFIAFFNTFKFAFKNFAGSLAIIVFMFALYFLINFMSMVMPKNPISLFIVTLLMLFYFCYYIMTISNFYYEKTKDNSDNRTECIG